MEKRAEALERSSTEWGEHMDIQAAAIYYNVDLQVVIETGRGKGYVEDVHSFIMDARRSRNAKKASRVIYFD